MTNFAISIDDGTTIVDIEKNICVVADRLDLIMGAVGDALSAAGFDEDPRLTQMKDYWAEINQTREVDFGDWFDLDEGITDVSPIGTPFSSYGSQDAVPAPTVFQLGDVVKVIRDDVEDSHKVAGCVGVVRKVYDCLPQIIGIKFATAPVGFWNVAPAALELLYRPE